MGSERNYSSPTLTDESQLEKRIRLAMRHNAPNNKRLITKVRNQANEFGYEYVLSNVSKEARLLFLRSREVSNEMYRGKAFVRFEGAGNLLVARCRFVHNVEGMIVRYFAQKFFPKMVLLLSRRAWLGRGGVVVSFSPSAIKQGYRAKVRRDALWDTYYDSCFIESRRNKGLAQKRVPKRFWEGMQEGIKLERGIQGDTLEEWL